MTTVFSKRLLQDDRERVVARVVVTASGTVSTVKNEPQVFHWRLYLVLAPDARLRPTSSQSVLFDMTPSLPPTGTFIIASKVEALSEARRKIELPLFTTGQPTVARLIHLFLEKGMDRYKFDSTGSGCYYWTMTGVQRLEEAGLIMPGSLKLLLDFHKEQAQLHPERHPLPVRRGEFYWYVDVLRSCLAYNMLISEYRARITQEDFGSGVIAVWQ
ncbi:hypothetical protein GSI_07205 [Ganoderma sinense ZZ0214-1]|uniref:DUF7770 domain-containing protein n=1 Tax=Ganoderma sinense ZZ0214-1 TaxID=1077348 RepID=A0A2G8S9R6_9APHY|nr:hypothetical protein GSI_07205 [Ganoderma sinense ZZ0214-1]